MPPIYIPRIFGMPCPLLGVPSFLPLLGPSRFDHHVLDMFEFGILAFTSIAHFSAEAAGGSTSESKPCLIFQGEGWEHGAELQVLRGLLVDFFQLKVVETISPLGIDRALVFTAAPSGDAKASHKVLLRHYVKRLPKGAEGVAPRIELVEMGPSIDLLLRRTHHPAPELMKAAMARPDTVGAAPQKVKNIERSIVSGRTGSLHLAKQDLTQLATANMKGLRKRTAGEEGLRKWPAGERATGPKNKKCRPNVQ